jgi:hypothetical protein
VVLEFEPEVLRQGCPGDTLGEHLPQRREEAVVLVIDEISDADGVPLVE